MSSSSNWSAAFFVFKQKTSYEMRISDWSSDVCSSDLPARARVDVVGRRKSRSGPQRARAVVAAEVEREAVARHRSARPLGGRRSLERTAHLHRAGLARPLAAGHEPRQLRGELRGIGIVDRKSVVTGKRVEERGEDSGRRDK